jgi:hypothetical protein
MTSRLVRHLCAAVALAFPLAVAACSSPTGEQSNAQALARARARWATAGVHSYTFVVTPSCFCDTRPFRVTVQNDAVTSRVYVDGGATVPANFYTEIESVPAMFGTIEKAIDQDAPTLSAAYDDNGVPIQVFIDWKANVYDEELGWTVSAFAPAP